MAVTLAEQKKLVYAARLEVERLRRLVFQQEDPAAAPKLQTVLLQAETDLAAAENIMAKLTDPKTSGVILNNTKQTGMLGAKTTGLEAEIQLRMNVVPTGIYHLLDPVQNPLVSATIRNAGSKTRRLRVISYIEHYSAQAVDTVEIDPNLSHTFFQLPTLFSERAAALTELTRAALNVQIEDLDGKIELHRSVPVWMLARNSAPLSVKDPVKGTWSDLTRYFGAWVTPNSPSVMRFLRQAAAKHPDGQLVGYQGSESDVEPQVKAIYAALKEGAALTYVNSVLDSNPDRGYNTQRVRLPREALDEKQANCIDGTVLYASLLEAISLNPAIVVIPGHAFVGWESWRDSGNWRYLETTMTGGFTYEQAVQSGETTAQKFQAEAQKPGQEHFFTRHSVKDLRVVENITPLE